jgi:hypothetical protein
LQIADLLGLGNASGNRRVHVAAGLDEKGANYQDNNEDLFSLHYLLRTL